MIFYPACWTLVSPNLSICNSPFRSPQLLNGTIPLSILKACLEDMALDKSEGMASDDPSKKGVLSLLKYGKSADTRLYYVNKTKLKLKGKKKNESSITAAIPFSPSPATVSNAGSSSNEAIDLVYSDSNSGSEQEGLDHAAENKLGAGDETRDEEDSKLDEEKSTVFKQACLSGRKRRRDSSLGRRFPTIYDHDGSDDSE
jgi:hypothetical protein